MDCKGYCYECLQVLTFQIDSLNRNICSFNVTITSIQNIAKQAVKVVLLLLLPL